MTSLSRNCSIEFKGQKYDIKRYHDTERGPGFNVFNPINLKTQNCEEIHRKRISIIHFELPLISFLKTKGIGEGIIGMPMTKYNIKTITPAKQVRKTREVEKGMLFWKRIELEEYVDYQSAVTKTENIPCPLSEVLVNGNDEAAVSVIYTVYSGKDYTGRNGNYINQIMIIPLSLYLEFKKIIRKDPNFIREIFNSVYPFLQNFDLGHQKMIPEVNGKIYIEFLEDEKDSGILNDKRIFNPANVIEYTPNL